MEIKGINVKLQTGDETVVAGMVDGLISVRRREEDVKDVIKPKRKKVSYRHAGENLHVRSVDVVVQQEVKEIMSRHDACLRKFQYSKALDCVMMNYVVSKMPHVTVALTQELIRREGLRRALAGRDGKSLVNIIKFLNRYIGNIRFGRVLLHVANVLLGKFLIFLFRLFFRESLENHVSYINKIYSLFNRRVRRPLGRTVGGDAKNVRCTIAKVTGRRAVNFSLVAIAGLNANDTVWR